MSKRAERRRCKRRKAVWHVYLSVCAFASVGNAFSLPGVQMVTYNKGDRLPLYVNSLTSSDTLLPLDYYKLPFCQPSKLEYKSENLGEYLTANRIQNSPYNLTFLQPQTCSLLCTKTYSTNQIRSFASRIQSDYQVHYIVDNLPISSVTPEGYLAVGYPLGQLAAKDASPRLNNHVNIVIGYNDANTQSPEQGRIVDFQAFPFSFAYEERDLIQSGGRMATCDWSSKVPPLYMVKNAKEARVYWTYSVEWMLKNDVDWRTRWDIYFEAGSGTDEVHWFSIINALLIVLFLSGMVGLILMRSLHRDISRYNRVPTDEERAEEREESGWKLVHADIFRPPATNPILFCVMVGSGMQVLTMSLVTLQFAALGMLAPSNRGKLVIALLVCFVLLGTLAGFVSARLYKMFRGKRWQLCTALTATLFPGVLFATFFFLNLFVWAWGSDAAVPFGSILLVFFLWTGISIPLVFTGAFFGFRMPPITFPVATSNIPRPIPPQPWYMTNMMAAVVGGVLPFGAIFVELFFVLSSIWTDKYYYVYGFLLISFFILINTCAEVTIVLTYFQLCAEDYKWWWRSFVVSGACGGYVFVYSCYYFWTRLDVSNFIGAMLYFGYMAMISGALSLLTGAVGFFASFVFTRKIYASIKVD